MLSPNLKHNYRELVERNSIIDDKAQHEILAQLQDIFNNLVKPKKKSFFRKKPEGVKSLYIFGNVGRGKSMLTDLFFSAVPETIKKRRVHFHAFMQEVHARIHHIRKSGKNDPVITLADEIASETELLCFDELQATDVTDASLLFRLFSRLFEKNLTIVSTSNRPPEELYTGGVQAERFADFIKLIKEKMRVASLDSPGDYRYRQGKRESQFYYYPLDGDAEKFIEHTLIYLGANGKPRKETLIVHGRQIVFDAYDNKIGIFTFGKLCETALGAADYLALARRLEIFILTDIPQLSAEKRNEAKRFCTLIDTLYEHKIKLICTAAVPPEEIYIDGDGSFEFARTVSRLVEMQSSGRVNKI